VDEFTTAVRLIDDIGVGVHASTADRLERAAELAAGKMLGMYDALFVQLARELELPLLTSDAKLGRAVAGTIQVEVLQGVGEQALPGEVPAGGEIARRDQPVRGRQGLRPSIEGSGSTAILAADVPPDSGAGLHGAVCAEGMDRPGD
jgi:hypothetical protein